MVRIVIGQVVCGEEFWNRKRELADIWRALETSSVLLTAPRRFGKTSIMQRLVDSPKNGWNAFYLDTEGIMGPQDFLIEIIAVLAHDKAFKLFLGKAGIFWGGLLNRIDEIGVSEFKISLRQELAQEWQEKGRQFIGLLKELQTRTILILDELPILIDNIAKKHSNNTAMDFLSWLRSLRQMPDLREKVRWVTGGSIGIEKVLQHIGFGTNVINDLERIHIREFGNKEAKDFIEAILRSNLETSESSKDVIGKFLEVIGIPIPYFIQILVRESLNEMEHLGKKVLSQEIIEQAYEQRVLASYNRTYFEYYYERLRHYYDDETQKVAKELLTEVARSSRLTKKQLWNKYQALTKDKGDKDSFSYLLSDLENDFYLKSDSNRDIFSFATKVLRDWWIRYHSL